MNFWNLGIKFFHLAYFLNQHINEKCNLILSKLHSEAQQKPVDKKCSSFILSSYQTKAGNSLFSQPRLTVQWNVLHSFIECHKNLSWGIVYEER